MSDKVRIEVVQSFGPYQQGDRTAVRPEVIDQLEEQGITVKRLNTAYDTTSKSDPETRERLHTEARIEEAEEALAADDYYQMKSCLAKLSDESANGTKEEVRKRLEDKVNELKQ